MQSSTSNQAEELHCSYLASSDWYCNFARPVLEEHTPERVQEFERQLDTLEQLAKLAKEPFTACFLGQSQIGKSTLINALVAEDKVLLPAGGIGPLTAQAIKVSYSEAPFLEVEYHPRQKIRDLRLVLESYLLRRNATAADAAPATAFGDADEEIGSEELLDLAAVEEATAFTPAMTERIKQATLLITGDQNSSRTLEYVCDSIRLALGLLPKWNTTAQAEDAVNIERLAKVLQAMPKLLSARTTTGTSGNSSSKAGCTLRGLSLPWFAT